MEKPMFLGWAKVVTLWYEHCPGANDAKRQAISKNDLDAMKRVSDLAGPIATEIGELSVQIIALEARRESLSRFYKELEKQYTEHSESYDKHQGG